MSVVAELTRTRDSLYRLEKLGGPDSFFGMMHVFQELLLEEHDKVGEAFNGMYSFHGMGQYGNIISWVPVVLAIKQFLALGHTIERLESLRDWYQGDARQPDEKLLGAYLKMALAAEDIHAYIEQVEAADAKVKAQEEQNEKAESEAAEDDGAGD
jgi:hypothetical protein